MAKCFEPSVADQLVRGALSEDELPELLGHAARCARCRQLVREAGQRGGGADALGAASLDSVQERLGVWRAARRAPGVPALKKGESVDRFVVIRVIGPSEDGVVYEGFDPEREQRVVIKLLDLPAEDSAATSLLTTARRLVRFSHPNVLPLLAAGEHAGHVYLVYEFHKGAPLSHHGASDARAVLGLFLQAGRALEAVHELGLCHGTFSAGACLVDRQGRVLVLDFGVTEARVRYLAKVSAHPEDDWPASGDHLRTEDSFIGFAPTRRAPTAPFESFILAAVPASLGARQYAAPEVVSGAPPSAAADQFAFAAALYHQLAKRAPFGAESISLWLRDVLRGAAAPPPAVAGVSRSAWSAIERALCADPSARFPRMGGLLSRLPARSPWGGRRARVALAGAAGAAALAGVAVAKSGSSASARGTCDTAAVEDWRRVTERGQALSATLGAVAPQAKERMSQWLGQWRAQTGEFCAAPVTARASASRSAPEHAALTRLCVQRARESFSEVVSLLGAAPRESLDRAAAAFDLLPSAEDCARAPELAAVPVVVARAEVRRRLGLLREASEIVESAPEGDTLPELSLVRARISIDRGELIEARRELETAAFGAQAAGDAALGMSAMVRRLSLACSPSERSLWRGFLQAQSALAPAAAPGRLEVESAVASALVCEGDGPAAARLVESVARASEGLRTPESAAAALALARVRLEQGDPIGAEAAAGRASTLLHELYGERHAEALAAQLVVAEARLAGSAWATAEPIIDRVAAATTSDTAERQDADAVRAGAWRLRGQLVVRRALAEPGLGYAEARARGAAAAIDPLSKAVAEYEAALGGAHPLLAAATVELSEALLEAGRHDEAQAAYRQAAAIFETLGFAASPKLAQARAGIALASWGARPPAQALELVRWGAAPAGVELDPSVEAWAALVLARSGARAKDDDRAEAWLRHAAKVAAPGSSARATALVELARHADERERPDAAELLDAALAAVPARGVDRAPLAAALARRLWAEDRPRAVALYEEAVAGFGEDSRAASELSRTLRKKVARR